jgi:hypothetical protein
MIDKNVVLKKSFHIKNKKTAVGILKQFKCFYWAKKYSDTLRNTHTISMRNFNKKQTISISISALKSQT